MGSFDEYLAVAMSAKRPFVECPQVKSLSAPTSLFLSHDRTSQPRRRRSLSLLHFGGRHGWKQPDRSSMSPFGAIDP